MSMTKLWASFSVVELIEFTKSISNSLLSGCVAWYHRERLDLKAQYIMDR